MTEERREIARQYVHNMINSFVEDPNSGNYYENYDPPYVGEASLPRQATSSPAYVSFYSPDIGRLLEKACHEDKYSVCHPQFDVLHDPHNEIYDIDGHRVCVISGTIDIYIDGVAYDQNELREGEALPPPGQQRCPYTKWRMEAAKANKSNKFHVRLPSHTK